MQGVGEPIDDGVLAMVEVDPPEPGPGQVRIRVAAAGIGLPDVLMCRSVYPLTPALPFTSGQEATGTVTAVGEGVDLALGTRVMGTTEFISGRGSFAEECLMRAEGAMAVPPGLHDAEAAGFWIPHMTGWIGLVDRGRLAEGEWLVVLGASGGSGIAAVQLGAALGARVIAVVGGEEKAAFCQRLGAHATLDHREGGLADRLRETTVGHGVDVIYDPVGGEVAADAARAFARHGRLLAVGFASGSWATFETHRLVVANASLVGVYAGDHTRAELETIHARLAELVAAGDLGGAVTDRVPFDELPAGLQRLADRGVVGKSVLVP